MNIPYLAASDGTLTMPFTARPGDNMPVMEKDVSVLIADDHPLIPDGLAALIESEPGFVLAGRASNGVQALERYSALRPSASRARHCPSANGKS